MFFFGNASNVVKNIWSPILPITVLLKLGTHLNRNYLSSWDGINCVGVKQIFNSNDSGYIIIKSINS